MKLSSTIPEVNDRVAFSVAGADVGELSMNVVGTSSSPACAD